MAVYKGSVTTVRVWIVDGKNAAETGQPPSFPIPRLGEFVFVPGKPSIFGKVVDVGHDYDFERHELEITVTVEREEE